MGFNNVDNDNASSAMGFNKDNDNASPVIAIGIKIIVSAGVLLFTAVLVLLGLHIYARYFLGRRGSFRRHRLAFATDQDPPTLQNVGLAKSAIEALPVFVYQSENQKEGHECAVCLCEFEEKEKARLLPRCNHSFHINCIDMWFHSHSTCPLCRASAQPDTPTDSVVVLIAHEAAAETDQQEPLPNVSEGNASTSMEPDSDSDIDLCPSCRHHEVLRSPTYGTNMLFWQRVSSTSNSDEATASTSGKTIDKITIDIPRRVGSFYSPRQFSSDGQQEFSPGGQSLKSPGIRLRSLKKLLTADKRVVPPSPDAGRNIHLESEGPSS